MITDLECVKVFSKDDILDVAKELEIAVDISIPYSKVFNLVVNDLMENGVPEIDNDVSDLLGSFLVTTGFIDEEGNLMEDDGKEEEDKPKPPCWSFYSEYDPSCQGCGVKIDCGKARIANRPECFGRYDNSDDNCKQCLELTECNKIQLSLTKKAGTKK